MSGFIIVYKSEKRAFFIYGFAKSDRDNIDKDEEVQFKKLASYGLNLTEDQLSELISIGQFLEVNFSEVNFSEVNKDD